MIGDDFWEIRNSKMLLEMIERQKPIGPTMSVMTSQWRSDIGLEVRLNSEEELIYQARWAVTN